MIKKIKDDSWKDIHDPYQITYDIFHRTRKNNPKMYMKQQKTQTSQGNLEGKKIKLEASRLQTILQTYSNQNSKVLAQKHTIRSLQQNREHRNESTHLWSITLSQKGQEYTMEKRQSL